MRTFFEGITAANKSLQALSTLPGGSYLLVERGILGGNTAIMGARYGHLKHQNTGTALWTIQYLGVCTLGHRRHEDFQDQSILCVSQAIAPIYL